MGPMISKAILAGHLWPTRGAVWPAGWLGHPVGKALGVFFHSKLQNFNLESEIATLLEMLL